MLFIAILWALGAPLPLLAEEPQAAGSLEQGLQLQAEGNLPEAIAVFHSIGSSPEAAVREGTCLGQLGRSAEAIQAYDRALLIGPKSYWAEVALFGKAEACLAAQDPDGAWSCIEMLRARFPESVHTVRAGIVEAKLNGQDPASSAAAYEQELQVAGQYEQAIRIGNTDESLRLLEELLARHPNSATALKAKASKGHLLWKKKQFQEAVVAWQDVLERAALSAPEARIVDQATMKIASLYRAMGKPEAARAYFEALLDKPEFASFAALSLMGMEFHELCRYHRLGKDIGRERAELLEYCRNLMVDPRLSELARVKAELRLCEIHSWTGQYADAVREAEAFVTKYQDSPHRTELVTARVFLGDALGRLGRWPEALEQCNAVVDEQHAAEPALLPGAYFQRWYALRRTKASAEQVQVAAEEFLVKFSTHPLAKGVLAQERGGE